MSDCLTIKLEFQIKSRSLYSSKNSWQVMVYQYLSDLREHKDLFPIDDVTFDEQRLEIIYYQNDWSGNAVATCYAIIYLHRERKFHIRKKDTLNNIKNYLEKKYKFITINY